MVKLGSLYNRNTANGGGATNVARHDLMHENARDHRDRLEFNQRVQEQRLLAEERRDWDRLSPDHGQLQVSRRTQTYAYLSFICRTDLSRSASILSLIYDSRVGCKQLEEKLRTTLVNSAHFTEGQCPLAISFPSYLEHFHHLRKYSDAKFHISLSGELPFRY